MRNLDELSTALGDTVYSERSQSTIILHAKDSRLNRTLHNSPLNFIVVSLHFSLRDPVLQFSFLPLFSVEKSSTSYLRRRTLYNRRMPI